MSRCLLVGRHLHTAMLESTYGEEGSCDLPCEAPGIVIDHLDV